MNHSIVIADASCFIALQNIGEVEILLKLFKYIYATPEVAAEVGPTLPGWVVIRSNTSQDDLKHLKTILDLGEATSIALAMETPESLLIIDEKKGRRVATQLGLTVIGTVGVVVRACESGIIDFPASVAERLERAGFHLSTDLRKELLTLIN